MRIFLTGGTGFVGSHFINAAHRAGHQITALRRTSHSRPRHPLESEPKWLDLAMADVPSETFAEHDALVHLAAHTANVPYDSYDMCMMKNAVEPLRMFQNAAAGGLKKWIVAGTCFEYGKSAENVPTITIELPLRPVGSYPASKAALSIAIQALARETGASVWLGRIFQVYGPGEAESRFWPTLRRKALAGEDFPMSEGQQVRDFTPVELVAAIFVEALEVSVPDTQTHVEHIATGRARTLIEFAAEWWERLGATGRLLPGAVPMRANEVMRYVPEISEWMRERLSETGAMDRAAGQVALAIPNHERFRSGG